MTCTLKCSCFVGHTINKLTKHSDEVVRSTATEVVKQWKTHFEQKLDKPKIEVKCDIKTEKLRKTGRKMLAAELKLNVSQTMYIYEYMHLSRKIVY